MPVSGSLYVGPRKVTASDTFKAANPATGDSMEPAISSAGAAEVDAACNLAWQAFHEYRALPDTARAAFLDAIGDEIMALGDELLERAGAESGLPLARLTGERGRTVGQLRLFAAELAAGGWHGVRIDPALPQREPLPRPDLRQQRIPLGPVAVFGASNFPLAFSAAGGDTASALAAGCPVVVKGHSAHPGTGDLVAQSVLAAAARTGMPDGVFSLLNGNSHALGGALVAHPHIKAVGFTGSRRGGLALKKIAAERAEPIPVYAEMSSINPVLLLPAALAENGAALAEAFVGSLTMGVGQFCTNPGLLIALEGEALQCFVEASAEALAKVEPAVMLTDGICAAYEDGVQRLLAEDSVELLARGAESMARNTGRGALFGVPGKALLEQPTLLQEVFGASSLLVRCADEAELLAVLEHLEGQLTATLHMIEDDYALAGRLLPVLERKAGRLIANGWPTGVDVAHAMVHGGPFPATSDGRSTSVGTLAIERFLRPVCYQNMPQALLPPMLRDDAPARPHRYDGEYRGG